MDDIEKKFIINSGKSVFMYISIISFFLALIFLVSRIIIYLKSGYWLKTLSDIIYYLFKSAEIKNNSARDFIVTIINGINSEWKGFNEILNWFILEVDVSLSALIISFTFMVLAIAWVIIISRIIYK